MRNVVIAWSGGYDSTLILYNTLIEEYGNTKRKEEPNIVAYSVEWDCISKNKDISEKRVRKSFKKMMNKKGYDFVHKIIKLDTPDCYGNGMPQQTLWAFISTFCSKYDSIVRFGYHKCDDYWTSYPQFENIRKTINNLRHKNIEFEYPLQYIKKYEIVNDIKKLNLEDYVWTCEDPIEPMKACGKCEPCINLKLAKYESELYKNIPKINNDDLTDNERI